MNENNSCGAMIERGSIESVGTEGYRVRSFTRYGFVTPVIPAIGNTNYSIGDHVYYFMFPDGNGLILAGF